MKKNLFKVLSLALVALMAMTCVASAAAVVGEYANGTVTATVTGIGTTDEVTILVVPHGTDLTELSNTDIIYIDQVTAVSGAATFSFASSTEEIDIYSGYTSMDVAQGALSDIYEAPVTPDPVTAPEIDMEKSSLVANAFSLAGFQRIFVKLAETETGDWMPAHSDENSSIYYSTERKGYDGLIKSTAADLTAALAELTWENVAPTAEQTIAMYGDMNNSLSINAADTAQLKKLIKNIGLGVNGTNDQYLKLDTSGDNKINAGDTAQFKKFIKAVAAGETYTFPAATK